MKDDVVETLRQPEYTGENRCGACTVVNLVIAGVLGAVLARRSKLAGAVAVGASLVLIYLRGYLVPGTPTLTKRYLPAEVLALFGKEPEAPEIHTGLGAAEPTVDGSARRITFDEDAAADSVANGRADAAGSTVESDQAGSDQTGSDVTANEPETGGNRADEAEADSPAQTPEEYFFEVGAVEPCEDVDDLCLTENFETAWFDEIERIETDAVDAVDAASAFGFDGVETGDQAASDGDTGDPVTSDDADENADDGADDSADADDGADDAFEIERHDDARVLRRGGRLAGKWPSQAALVADVTAARVLAERDPEWERYPSETKGQLLNGLRLFLETCPTSGGAVVMGEETVESCCRSHDVVAVTCEDTGERLFEHPVDGIEA